MKRHTIEEVTELILVFYNNSKVGETTIEPFFAEDSLDLPYYLSHIAQGGSHAVLVHEECDGLWTRALLIPMNEENGKDEIASALEWYFNN